MSYYYNYYLGYKKDGKFYPMAPYDRKGKLESILWKSRSFASDLHEDFRIIKNEDISDELYKAMLTDDCLKDCKEANIPYSEERLKELAKFYGGDVKNVPQKKLKTPREAMADCIIIRYLPIDSLPEGKLIKEGYVQYSEIECGEDEGFSDVITPHEYAERLKIAATLGDIPKKDCEGNEFPRLSDYIYHKWIDSDSKEYEAYILRDQAELFRDYSVDEDELVILETEG